MKTTIPAVRGRIGTTIYYSTSFTFRQIADLVKQVNDELHTATSLKEEIQRSLNNNYLKIKDYILSKPDHFFNSLVLAVYDGCPQWTEIQFELNDISYPNVGILSFNGEEKIFPVDGQHRVEGIRSALNDNSMLATETIGVILIGHSKTLEGMEKSRRIFSTLNRYAKPVKMGDIIALDEDDIVAIVTRDQLEKNPLLMKDRIRAINSKAIPVTDKRSFTTLMTLYDCHKDLFQYFYFTETEVRFTETKLKEYLRTRPDDELITRFDSFVSSFWSSFSRVFTEIQSYLSDDSQTAANEYRSQEDGGNILFRPVALGPLISAVVTIAFRSAGKSINDILSRFNSINRRVSSSPWTLILWNPRNHRMIVKNKSLIRLMFLWYYSHEILTQKEKDDLYLRFSTVHNISKEEAIAYLEHIFD